MVNVVNGTTDLYVEHHGAGAAFALPAGLMFSQLRQLGATKVTTSQKRTDLCNTFYQICRKHFVSRGSAKSATSSPELVARAFGVCIAT